MIKRNSKKVFVKVAFIISVCTCFALPVLGYGAAKADVMKKPVLPPELDYPAAYLYIFSTVGQGSSFVAGHAFIAVKNIFYKTLTIGKMTVTHNSTITIGTWQGNTHYGVWYNIENYRINVKDMYQDRVSMYDTIYDDDINTINEYILSHDYWNFSYNCANFAVGLWNSVADQTLSNLGTPTALYELILNHPHSLNLSIDYDDRAGFYSEDYFIKASDVGVY